MSAATSGELSQAETPAPGPGYIPVDQRVIVALAIRPGDHLPPQPALHGTPYQQDGFTVGTDDRDVLAGIAVLPGRMLLFGPRGTLDSVAATAKVTVRRGTQ
jgi:hypothetical protein